MKDESHPQTAHLSYKLPLFGNYTIVRILPYQSLCSPAAQVTGGNTILIRGERVVSRQRRRN